MSRAFCVLFVLAAQLIGSTGGPGTSVSDGYFVMLAPLSAGQHTIHFKGSEGAAPNTFTLDITYHLTVQPKAVGQLGDDDDDQD